VTVVNSQSGATLTTRSNHEGRWIVSGVQPGPVRLKVDSPGFQSFQQELDMKSSRAAHLGVTLQASGAAETVTVTASQTDLEREGRRIEDRLRKGEAHASTLGVNVPSQNVFNLQKRVAGVLPVRVDVPRAGKSYRFVRPLVLEEETRISFQYKTR
jgi:protocatechuate 3,4-dioxygenase beta subunit